MSHELIELYQDLLKRPDPFEQIPLSTKMALTRLLLALGETVPPELENLLSDQIEQDTWQKLET